MPSGYRSADTVRLYRSLLKGAYKFPLASRRTIVTSEVKEHFRSPHNQTLTTSEVDYKLTLGWERAATINVYATNMHWFHSRDEVNKEMLHHSLRRDQERVAKMEKHNEEGSAELLPTEYTTFHTAFDNSSPGYRKMKEIPLKSPRDIWRARGQHGADLAGPKQKFFVRRFQSVFPQGW